MFHRDSQYSSVWTPLASDSKCLPHRSFMNFCGVYEETKWSKTNVLMNSVTSTCRRHEVKGRWPNFREVADQIDTYASLSPVCFDGRQGIQVRSYCTFSLNTRTQFSPPLGLPVLYRSFAMSQDFFGTESTQCVKMNRGLHSFRLQQT